MESLVSLVSSELLTQSWSSTKVLEVKNKKASAQEISNEKFPGLEDQNVRAIALHL